MKSCILSIFIIFLMAGTAFATCTPPGHGIWIINETCEYTGQNIKFAGNISIYSSGLLKLLGGSTITFYGIDKYISVFRGGQINIFRSGMITKSNSTLLTQTFSREPACTPDNPANYIAPYPDEHWYYYNSELKEAKGLQVNLTQRCVTIHECPGTYTVTDCGDAAYLRSTFGSDTVPAGGALTFQDEAIGTYCNPGSITVNYTGIASNGDMLTYSFTRNLTGC